MPRISWESYVTIRDGEYPKTNSFGNSNVFNFCKSNNFRESTSVRSSKADRLRTCGRRSSDSSWGGFSKDRRHVDKLHHCSMMFAWAAVLVTWVAGMILISII